MQSRPFTTDAHARSALTGGTVRTVRSDPAFSGAFRRRKSRSSSAATLELMRVLGLNPDDIVDQHVVPFKTTPAAVVRKPASRLHVVPNRALAATKPGAWKNGPKLPVFSAPPLLTLHFPGNRRLSIPSFDLALFRAIGRQFLRMQRFTRTITIPRLQIPMPQIHITAPRIHINAAPMTRLAMYGLGVACCGAVAVGASMTMDRVHQARQQANQMAQQAAVANARVAALEWESQHLSRSLHALEQQDTKLRAVLAQTIATSTNTTVTTTSSAVNTAPLPGATMSAADRAIVDSTTIPSLDPTGGSEEVTSTFGWRSAPWPEFHKGIDLAVPQGHPVMAAAAGIVVSASPGWNGGFGNFIDIDHGNGFHTYYGHLSQIDVRNGQHVTRGMLIAAVGMTGDATGPHLHYQIMHNGTAIDPAPFLHGVPAWAMDSHSGTKARD